MKVINEEEYPGMPLEFTKKFPVVFVGSMNIVGIAANMKFFLMWGSPEVAQYALEHKNHGSEASTEKLVLTTHFVRPVDRFLKFDEVYLDANTCCLMLGVPNGDTPDEISFSLSRIEGFARYVHSKAAYRKHKAWDESSTSTSTLSTLSSYDASDEESTSEPRNSRILDHSYSLPPPEGAGSGAKSKERRVNRRPAAGKKPISKKELKISNVPLQKPYKVSIYPPGVCTKDALRRIAPEFMGHFEKKPYYMSIIRMNPGIIL